VNDESDTGQEATFSPESEPYKTETLDVSSYHDTLVLLIAGRELELGKGQLGQNADDVNNLEKDRWRGGRDG
jgi:hypothetical protein